MQRTEWPRQGALKCSGYAVDLGARCPHRAGCWRYVMPERVASGLMVPDLAQPQCPYYVPICGRDR